MTPDLFAALAPPAPPPPPDKHALGRAVDDALTAALADESDDAWAAFRAAKRAYFVACGYGVEGT
jgi:hypothetical protein